MQFMCEVLEEANSNMNQGSTTKLEVRQVKNRENLNMNTGVRHSLHDHLLRILTCMTLIHDRLWMCVFSPVRSCPALSAPHHGQLNCSDGGSSSRLECTVRCQKGYRLEGKAKLTCLSTSQWSSPPPRCVGKITSVCVSHIWTSGAAS